jgi:hypothetical protein
VQNLTDPNSDEHQHLIEALIGMEKESQLPATDGAIFYQDKANCQPLMVLFFIRTKPTASH